MAHLDEGLRLRDQGLGAQQSRTCSLCLSFGMNLLVKGSGFCLGVLVQKMLFGSWQCLGFKVGQGLGFRQ